jgi:hypothetical protein
MPQAMGMFPLAPVATLAPTTQATQRGKTPWARTKTPHPHPHPHPHHETPTFGNTDLPQEGMVNTTGDPASATMTGPRNPVLESQFPSVITASATDIGSSGPRSTSRPGDSSAGDGRPRGLPHPWR